MSLTFKRLLAAGIAAAVAFVAPAAAPTASAATNSNSTTAAKYLSSKVGSVVGTPSTEITAALGLAAKGKCTYAGSVHTIVNDLVKQAKPYTAGSPAAAANLAIAVKALGLNPKSFGKVNLIKGITAGLPKSGQIGSMPSAFSQSLAIIALKRAKAKIPSSIVKNLVAQQDASGAFGYTFGGTFTADPDTTGLAIVALKAAGGHSKQISRAAYWAKKNQNAKGYWGTWSPSDSTGLLGSALKAVGKYPDSVKKARSWLATQQLKDGGFPNSLNGTTSDPYATAEALYLVTGRTLLTASLKLTACDYAKAPKPRITGTAKVGQTLTAVTGTWKPQPVSFNYKWYRSGKAIKGATKATYTVAKADKGKKLTVKVTTKGTGYKTVARTSRPTAKVTL